MADSILYRSKNKREKKHTYFFSNVVTRAIYLELLPDQITYEFIRALKRLNARGGCPETIYSDNPKTYVAASKWIKKINKLEILHHLLNIQSESIALVEWII